MDIVRTDTKQKMHKKALISISLTLIVTLSFLFATTGMNASYLADRDTLLIDTVQRGDLHITVRGTGVLVPYDIRWISIDVSGRVERVLKKAGAKVQEGDLILELSNPQLRQQLTEAKWQLQALEAETQARRVVLESDLLDQEIAVTNEKLNHERALLTLGAQKTLLEQGIVAISKIDYEEVKIDVSQYQQRWELEQHRLVKRKENLQAQIKASNARLALMRKTVQRIQHQVDSLKVRASIDSIIQEMPMELGQQIEAGANLAKLARSDLYIAELRIPEKQIKDVAIGQTVTLDTRSNKISGRVSRIDPAVSNSSVLIDVELSGTLPKEVRPELTVDGEIEITTINDTLFVKRPMFASGFSQSDIYRVDYEQSQATKHRVSLGVMSSQFVQVEHGLAEGDLIIVSDTSAWQQHQQIGIN